jgi:hypothetical protein
MQRLNALHWQLSGIKPMTNKASVLLFINQLFENAFGREGQEKERCRDQKILNFHVRCLKV